MSAEAQSCIAIVPGTGIGRAAAQALPAAGWRLVLAGRRLEYGAGGA